MATQIDDAGGLGVDLACVTDITKTFTLTSGLANLGMRLARRFITPRGGLFYDNDYGLDLRSMLSAAVTSDELKVLAEACRLEALKEEEVSTCTVDLTFDAGAQRLTVKIRGVAADAPFTLVLAASAVTVEILSLGDAA